MEENKKSIKCRKKQNMKYKNTLEKNVYAKQSEMLRIF